MEARLGLVEGEERRGAGGKGGGEQGEEAQGPVRSLGRLERPQEAGDVQAEGESAVFADELEGRAWESLRDGLVEHRTVADLPDGHERGGEVATVVGERGSAHADLRLPRR